MKNLDYIANDLFNKIRGRFPSVTIGNEEGKVTNVPTEARYFDFEYKEGDKALGKVSISLDENSIAVMYSDDFVANEDTMTRNNWYNFLKELRAFSKKRLLNFDTRNITKSNLDRRDYKFLATNRIGDDQMNESTMYGTSRTSFQNIGNARVAIKHSQPVDQSNPADRARHFESIYVESNEGERFKYPFRHLAGARAMARHVSEGGKPYDDFGSYIVGMSEELSKLRKFKTYVGRSSVMAEGLSGYMDIVAERMEGLRKSIKSLQRETAYKEAFEGFEKPVVEDVPEDVAENWIDQLTIRQFNEELKDVFPYIYKLVSEATKATELNPNDFMNEEPGVWDTVKSAARTARNAVFGSPEEQKAKQDFENLMAQTIRQKSGDNSAAGRVYAACLGDPLECLYSYMVQKRLNDPKIDATAKQFGLTGRANMNVESEFEAALDDAMGQFGEKKGRDLDMDGDVDSDDYKKAKDIAIKKAMGQKEQKTPLGEFILSYFDYTTGQFPKGETAVLTMVEKDYGEQYITPAKKFIERINSRVAEVMGYKEEPVVQDNTELDSIRQLAGL